MTQRTQMYYAYFRFYVDEADIIAGMETYCKEWENMYAVGYNYREYKCFVDNLGGFEHWVGDMRGYITPARETGFLDAAPSDALYDATLLMGQAKIDVPDPAWLHFLKPPVSMYVRKLIGTSAAEASTKTTFGSGENIAHAFYGAIDLSQIEIANYTQEMVTATTGTPNTSYSLDISKTYSVPTVDGASTVSNPANSVDGNFDTYASVSRAEYKNLYLDLGSIQDIYNICYKYKLSSPTTGGSGIELFYGDTIGGCTNSIEADTTVPGQTKTVHKTPYRDLAISGRYLRFYMYASDSAGNLGYLYQALVS